MDKAKEWLAGPRNFFVGRALYKAIGDDQDLMELLEKGKTPFTVQQLTLAMTALADGAPKVIDKPKPKATKTKQKLVQARLPMEAEKQPTEQRTGEKLYMPEEDHSVLRAIRLEWLQPYREMQYKIGQLDKYGDANTPEAINYRSELADDILRLERKCQDAWEKRDYYLEHGELPVPQSKVIKAPTDPAALAILIIKIKRNIDYNRREMTKNPDNVDAAQKYLLYKSQFKQLTGKEFKGKLDD